MRAFGAVRIFGQREWTRHSHDESSNHMHRIRTTAITALVAVALVACGSDDSGSTSDESSSEGATSQESSSEETIDSPFGEGEVGDLRELLASFGAPIDETACVAEELAGEVSQDDLRTFLEAVDAEDSDIDPEVALAFNEAVSACGLG